LVNDPKFSSKRKGSYTDKRGRKSYSDSSSVTKVSRPVGQRIRHGGFGAMARVVPTSPKIITIIFIYMFLLTTTTLAFQAGVAELEAGGSGFDPSTVLEGAGVPTIHRDSWMRMSTVGHLSFIRKNYYDVEFDEYNGAVGGTLIGYVGWAQVYFRHNHWANDLYERCVRYLDDSNFIVVDPDNNWIFYINRLDEDNFTGVQQDLYFWIVNDQNPYETWLYGDQCDVEIVNTQDLYTVSDTGVVQEHQGWMGKVGKFFESITAGFSMLGDILFFNFYPVVALPAELIWIPFFMALPVYVYVTLLVMPLAISAVQAIGNLIPFT